MIVVIGATELRGTGTDAVPGGVAGRIAVAAAAAGSRVELVAKVGDDPVGDALLLALARAGVGHVAVLRDGVHRTQHATTEDDEAVDPATLGGHADDEPVGPAGPALEPADVGLALRYLTDFRVVVVVDPSPGIVTEVVAAADWAGARLVIVDTTGGATEPVGVPDTTLVVAVEPDVGPTGADAVSARLGTFAAALADGREPAAAYAELTAPATP